jgi:acyl-coenzyme A thioesterase PaaI-like protein
MDTSSAARIESLASFLPQAMRNTLFLRAFGLFQVPLIFACRPKVLELTNERTVVKFPLIRMTRNHLRSMYFGALAIGADCAGGMIAMKLITEAKADVSLVFKDLQAEFLKRAEGDVYFTCEDGAAISETVRKTIETDERQNVPVHVVATCPSKLGNEPVAKFTLTLSLKKRK